MQSLIMITTRLQKNGKNIVIVCHGGVISALITPPGQYSLLPFYFAYGF